MKVFVTGSQGFVGRHLCDAMREKNVTIIKGARTARNSDEISYGDLNQMIDWSQLLRNVDVIVHLAAHVHVLQKSTDLILAEYMNINCDATLRIAIAAKTIGVGRFVYLSSVKVNGEETFDRPFSADDTPQPRDAYSQSKYEAEIKLMRLHEAGRFEVVIIRPPLVYGPSVKANFAKLMKIASYGIPLPFGKVNNKRSLISVYNLCDLIITCCQHPSAAGQVFLASDDHDLSLKEMIEKMALAQHKRAWLLPVPVWLMQILARLVGRSDYVQRLFGNLQVDIQKTKMLLGWHPPFQFEDTFKKASKNQ